MNNTNIKPSPYGGVGGGFLLLLVLVCSCKTKTTVEENASATTAAFVARHDSVVRTMDLRFDELDYWFAPPADSIDSAALPPSAPLRHIRIKGGVLQQGENRITDARCEDFTRAEYSTHKARDYLPSTGKFNLLVAALLTIILIIMIVRIRPLSP